MTKNLKPNVSRGANIPQKKAGNLKSHRFFRFFYSYKFLFSSAGVAFIAFFVYLLLLPPPDASKTLVNDPILIDHVNYFSKTFKAGNSERFENWTLGDVKAVFGYSFISTFSEKLPICTSKDIPIPKSYNVLTQYKHCFEDYVPKDSGNCSSDYAISLASSSSDRICILTRKRIEFSAQDIISCNPVSQGCAGGPLDAIAANYLMYEMLPESCFPYNAHINRDTECSRKCDNSVKGYKFSQICVAKDENDVMKEILHFGPVLTMISITNDMLIYKSGVYERLKTSKLLLLEGMRPSLMSHIVKIMGWGEENNIPYWLIEFTFGPKFGDGGFMKIARSTILPFESTFLSIRPFLPMDKTTI